MSIMEGTMQVAKETGISVEQLVWADHIKSYLTFIAWNKPEELDNEIVEYGKYLEIFEDFEDLLANLREVAQSQLAPEKIRARQKHPNEIPFTDGEGKYVPEYVSYLGYIAGSLINAAWNEPDKLDEQLTFYQSVVLEHWKPQFLTELPEIALSRSKQGKEEIAAKMSKIELKEKVEREAEKIGISPEMYTYLGNVWSYLSWVAWNEPEKLDSNLSKLSERDSPPKDFVSELHKIAKRQLRPEKVKERKEHPSAIPVNNVKGELTPEYRAYLDNIQSSLLYTAWNEPEKLRELLELHREDLTKYFPLEFTLDLLSMAKTQEIKST